jgi:hypothetical protein
MAEEAHEETTTETTTLADKIASGVLLPVDVARRVLPDTSLPVYLGLGALAVADVIGWPVAVASGIGYAVLKRWR